MLSFSTIVALAALQTPNMNASITSTNLPKTAVDGIATTLTNLEKAWNTQDIDLYGKQLDEQCNWVNVVGMRWRGKQNVVKAHAVYFEIMFKGVPQAFQTVEIRGFTDTVAVAICTLKMAAYKTPDGRSMPANLNRMTLTMVLKGDRWLIGSAQNAIVDPMAMPFNPIADDKDGE